VSEPIYAGVGRVLSAWEEIVLSCAHLYAAFCGRGDYDLDVMRVYGAQTVFSSRIAALRDHAGSYFKTSPNQSHEGDFKRLCDTAQNFSHRRNDVAHGSVRVFNVIGVDHVPDEPAALSKYYLVPTFYRGKRFTPQNMPMYAYRATELRFLEDQLYSLALDIAAFGAKLQVR
jgi:hypothetical protein